MSGSRSGQWLRPGARLAPIALLLGFWAITLARIDRSPPLHVDEVSILAPGWTLFSEGRYSLDMYTGFFQQETIYLEVMPLMSLSQGLSAQFLGLRVWSLRFLPAACGLAILALTMTLGRRLAGSLAGLLAGFLLVIWQWAAADGAYSGTGILLLDTARIGRYDILSALLGLAAFFLWLHARQRGSWVWFAMCGLLIGLAGLAQIYGLFWLAVFGLLWLGDRRRWRAGGRPRPRPAHLAALLGGAAIVLLPWVVAILRHEVAFVGQWRKHQGRFDLLDPAFYAANLAAEGHRYQLRPFDPETWGRMGFWLFVLGLPLALGWLTHRALRRGDDHAFQLLTPCLVLPGMLALLVSKKQPGYFLLVWPLFAVAVAWPLSLIVNGHRQRVRWLILGLLVLIVIQGSLALVAFQGRAAGRALPDPFFRQLSAMGLDGRILGPQTYWFAFPKASFRSFGLPYVLANTDPDNANAFVAALESVSPDYLIMNPTTQAWLRVIDPQAPYSGLRNEQFQTFLRAHGATLTSELRDHEGGEVQIYHLQYPAGDEAD